ncbi:hypothetical protein ABZ912_29385 [Nonomuraea angiospora]|uniref:hypothetical protein n=1 Tax=Nonomuraea angiospora TaxID=46172 RepID=UPI0033F71471
MTSPAGGIVLGGDATRQERIFRTISQLLGEQPLVADVRAALFRALPMIQGVRPLQPCPGQCRRRAPARSPSGVSPGRRRS